MKLETVFLKVVLFLMGIPVLGLSIFWLPGLANLARAINPWFAYLFLIDLYGTVIPFFFALYQSFLLLSYIEQGKGFSELSLKALKHIKYCGIAIGFLYVVGMPLLYLIAEIDDAPGIIVIGMIITLASTVIAVLADVLHKLLKNAIDMKAAHNETVANE